MVNAGTMSSGEVTAMEQKSIVQNAPVQAAVGAIDNATLELLAQWKAEDITKDPEAIRSAERELAEFKRAMNESRTESGEPLLFPLCANMTETSCVTAISEQGGKEIQHGNNERYCSPGV